jgi:hypothetical protein
MYKSKNMFWLIAISYWLIAATGCSPKIKMGLWAKKHQDAALALGVWSASDPLEAASLLTIDCTDRKQFKKKISDALTNTPQAQPTQQGYDVRQHNYHYGSVTSSRSEDGFADWCKQYPKAAKKLRSHAKALCKTGLGILNGSIKIN